MITTVVVPRRASIGSANPNLSPPRSNGRMVPHVDVEMQVPAPQANVPENFMNTTLMPLQTLERIWDKVVRACLQRPHEPVTYEELSILYSAWTPLFP